MARLRLPWRRGEARLSLPVIYNNDGNAAALYADDQHFGSEASRLRHQSRRSSGQGSGGGIARRRSGGARRGRDGRRARHVQIPMDGLLVPGSRCPGATAALRRRRERGFVERNRQQPAAILADPLSGSSPRRRRPRSPPGGSATTAIGRRTGPHIFDQQAMAIGRMFTIAANFLDPDTFFVGGGVTDASLAFRTRFIEASRADATTRRAGHGREFAISRPRHGRCPRAPHWRPSRAIRP